MSARAGRRPAWALALAVGLLLAGAARAESRRVEVVGVSPAGESAPEGAAPRQVALDDALARATLRVAAELLGSTPEALEAQGGLADVLPRPPAAYALRFRVLEDRGERRALLLADVATERALHVEVFVDAGRLADDLRAAGRLAGPEPAAAAGAVTVELVDVPSWRAWADVRDALRAADAETVRPRRFEAGRAVLEVRGVPGGSRLLARLEARLPEGLTIEPLDVDATRLRLRVRDRRPPAAAPSSAPSRPGGA